MNKSLLPKSFSAVMGVAKGKVIRAIRVDLVDADPDQPRKEFPEASLIELGDALAERQLQPIEVIELAGGRYRLVFGERRWRAALRKGLTTLDAIVLPQASIDADEILVRQLVENLQREDMSAADKAAAFARGVERFGSGAALAKKLSVSPAQVSKYLSLLDLPPAAAALAQTAQDVETIVTLGKIERQSPAAAQALVAEIATTGAISRSRVREVAKTVAASAPARAKKAAAAPTAPATGKATREVGAAAAVAPAAPARLRTGEAVQIRVRIADSSRDAKRWGRAKEEHGEPTLYLQGVSREGPGRCWVQFGATTEPRKGDVSPRLQEFPCNVLSVAGVGKAKPD